ncbi:MAG: hypothetical protein WB473_04595 [Pedococcus sp.]
MSEPTDPTRPMTAQPPQAPPGPPTRRPGLWRQATSTTGGTIAVVVAGVLTLLLVVGVLGVGAVAVVRTVAGHDDLGSRVEQLRDRRDGDALPGNGKGNGKDNGKDRSNGNDKVKGDRGTADGPRGRGGLGGRGTAAGPGSVPRGIAALGAVQHGEFTVQDAAGKAVVMTMQRGTVTAASATSVTVRSADGFSATYAVDDATRRPAGDLARDDTVLVVARKDGGKAVTIRAVHSS